VQNGTKNPEKSARKHQLEKTVVIEFQKKNSGAVISQITHHSAEPEESPGFVNPIRLSNPDDVNRVGHI
jgi:hypothetical protein